MHWSANDDQHEDRVTMVQFKQLLHSFHAKGVMCLLLMVMTAEAGHAGPRALELHSRTVKVTVEKVDGRYSDAYFARSGSAWIAMLESGSSARRDPSLRHDSRDEPAAYTSAMMGKTGAGKKALVLEGASGEISYRKTITLEDDNSCALVSVAMTVHGTRRIGQLLSTYSFSPDHRLYAQYAPLDFIFTPQLRPEPDQVIADHVFRSPALMLQKDGRFAALVPDLASIDMKKRPLRTTADVQIETADKPFFSFGLQNWIAEPYSRRQSHVFYDAPDSLSATVSDTTLSYAFRLFVQADAPRLSGFTSIVRFHWQHSGAASMQSTHSPQGKPFAEYIHKAWYEFLPTIALDTLYQHTPVTLLRQGRLAWSNKLPPAADNDSWFNVWFNSLRTAYGMYLHGRTAGDEKLMDQAVRVLNLALLAPQHEGIAPTIFYVDSTGGHWVADQAWGSIGKGEYFPMFANAWTCYWLLQWSDLQPARKREILDYTKRFADFLGKHQSASGVIPSWYDPVTLEPAREFRDENAETAGAALFLAEFARRGGDSLYLHASEQAMRSITERVLPERKWFDHETFFSCSRKPLGFFDRYTRQHPQNTLSMHQAAEAYLALYGLTHRREYLELGTTVLDYLCLYQQVWSPAWLSCELFGGFGVQNTDGEWSDSRQGYFAVTFMKYYEATGRREYFERGVAALRAMFSLFESPTSPRTAENYSHSAIDKLAGVTGIHWGTGSSVVSIHLITGTYGDAYIDVKNGWGVGIDGCRIPHVTVDKSEIRITLVDNVATHREITMKFGTLVKQSYTVIVNGVPYGSIAAKDLRSGIKVQL
jgi:hypothetical protein